MSLTGSAAAGVDFSNAHTLAPIAATSGLLVSMPVWLGYLRQVSEVAADLAPLVGVAIGLATLYRTARSSSPAIVKRRKKSFFARLRDTSKEMASKGGVVALIAVILLALAAVATHFVRPARADAAPLAILSAPAATGRRKSADDAGEDGTESGPALVDSAPPWFNIGLALRGTHEGTRRKPNPIVLAMYADAGHGEVSSDADVPWCAAFVGACLKRAGYPNTQNLMARSYATYGVACEPRAGCIVVLWRGSKTSGEGHVGFLVSHDASSVTLLGGNQGDAVSVARFSKSKVLAYRWPRELHQLRTVKGSAVAAIGAAGAAGSGVAVVTDQLQAVQTPLQNSGSDAAIRLAAYIGVACALLTLGAVVYTLIRRVRDYREGR